MTQISSLEISQAPDQFPLLEQDFTILVEKDIHEIKSDTSLKVVGASVQQIQPKW